MRKSARSWKERICALLLAAAMVITWMMPNAAVTVEAAPGDAVDVSFKVTDSASQSELSNLTITVKDQSGSELGNLTLPNNDNKTTISLEEGTEYAYEVTKTGYEIGNGSFTAPPADNNEPIEIGLTMSDIRIIQDKSIIHVDDTAIFSVENAVEGAAYTWTSSNDNVATVDQNGNVKAVGEGSAQITASYNGKTSNEITVSPAKIDTAVSLQLTPTPDANSDVTSVTCTASGLPTDATGTVTFSVNGTSQSVDVSNGSASWTYSDADKLIGDVTFTAVYSGNNKYNGSSNTADLNGLKRTYEVKFTDGNSEDAPKLVTKDVNDSEEAVSFQIPVNKDKNVLHGRDLSYKSSDEGILTVDADGKVTVVGNGEAYVTVTAEEAGNYLESEKNYYVYSQKPVDIDSLNLTADPVSNRIYDGTTNIQVTAPIDQSTLEGLGIYTGDLDTTNGLTVNITGNFGQADGDFEQADVNAQPYKMVTISAINDITAKTTEGSTISIKDRIEITGYEGTEIDASVTVVQRNVYLKINLKTGIFSIEYGKDIKTALQSEAGMVTAVEPDDTTGIVAGDVVDMSAFRATVDKDIYSVGRYPSVIKPNMDTVSDTKNYHFEITSDTGLFGTLEVTESMMTKEDILNSIEISVEDGTRYEENNHIWINGGKLKASITDGEVAKYFDQVILNVNGTGYDLCTAGFDTKDISGTMEIGDTIRLQKKDGVEKDKTADYPYSFTLDKTDPDFVFGDWAGKTKVSDTWVTAITFNNYQKTVYSIENVKATDNIKETAFDEISDVTQSGVKDWSYSVYEVKSDDDLTQENLPTAIENANWTPGTGTSIPVITGANGQLDTLPGNYIVLVKVSDNVGNTAVYSSNGLVLDVTQPSITITQADGTPINPDTYYKNDVDYKITLTDGDVSAGLERAVVKLYDGNKELKSERKEYKIDDLSVDYTKKEGYTLSQIADNLTSYIIEGTFPAKYDSNNLRIEVTAYDQTEPDGPEDQNPGNKYTASQNLMIDATDPEITVSYNNDADVKNDKYFKTVREMTIEYKEKNFDVERITFDVKAGPNIDSMALAEDVALDQLELEPYNIKVGAITDSEQNSDKTTYTNNRTNTLTLTFDEDNEYYIVPHVEDLSGRAGSSVDYGSTSGIIQKEFVIDRTAPVISVDYTTGDGAFSPKSELLADGERAYSKKAVTAAVTINEKNFWLEDRTDKSFATDQFTFDGTQGVDSRDASVGIEDYLAIAEDASDTNWGTNGYARTSSNFVFETDANYTFTFTYTDLAGNPVTYDSVYFTVDKPETDSPEGAVSLDREGSIWSTIWRAITFNIFRNSSYEVTLDSEDGISGVDSIEYYKTPNPVSQNTDMTGLNWRNLGISGEKAARSGNFSVSPDEQFVVYEKITDYAGNITYIYPTNGAVADAAEPRITITEANAGAASNGIYNEDVRLHISVEDPVNGGTYSGIERIWYEVRSSGNVTNSLERELANNSDNRVQGYRTWSGDITIDAEQFNSNDVRVQVHAVDFSGNQYDSEVTELKIDVTEPTIEVAYDLNSPLNDRYYNQTRTATVTVTERNFDPSAVRFNITNTDGTQPSISGWDNSSNSGVSDSATHTCTVTFAADGDYTFTLNTTDLAGNDSNYTRVDEFTIDQTDPTIQVSYDNNNDAESGYFNADRTATITVTEHNFNAAEVNTAITASLEGRGVSTPGLGGWSTRGDVHTASVTFSADADYTFDVDYTDLAGNAAADYEQDSFTVDQTAPELEFFDIEDKSANNDVVAPGVRYSDNNYTENGVEITLEGANHGEMELDGDRSSIPNGESIKMADFEHTKENDDLYTMTAVIRDRAGNETEDSVIFSVNRFGSVFVLSDETQELVDNYYTNEEQDLVVTEINVDSLVFNGISYGRDGELVNLEAGTDYEVKASGSEVSWKQYDYTINKENFEKEGNYTVTIDSEDRATNVGNSRAKGCDIEFAIDKTAPTVVITGIEDDAQYRANTRNITVNAADNIAMGDVGVYLGDSDKPVQSYDAKDIQAAGGELTYTMSSSNSRQDIRAVATDAAGNTAEAEITRVLLTSNLFVQFYSNTPLLVGSIVGVVVIAGGLLWFFLIFKKKKEEKQANK